MRTRHPREIDFRLLRSVGAKIYCSVSSDARKEADEKIRPQGVYDCAYPLGKRNQTYRPLTVGRYLERPVSESFCLSPSGVLLGVKLQPSRLPLHLNKNPPLSGAKCAKCAIGYYTDI